VQDDEISNRQKPSPAALEAIRDMLTAPLPTYRNARPKVPLKPEKNVARRRSTPKVER
jgi:hypothetical protein